jgi:hypothetical protein
MSVFCVTLGAMLLMGFILPTVKRLQCESLGFDKQIGADDTQLDVQRLDAM